MNNYKSCPSDYSGIVHTPQQNPKIKREKEREAKCKIPWGRPEGRRCRSRQHVEASEVRKDSRPSVSVASFDPIGLISDAWSLLKFQVEAPSLRHTYVLDDGFSSGGVGRCWGFFFLYVVSDFRLGKFLILIDRCVFVLGFGWLVGWFFFFNFFYLF